MSFDYNLHVFHSPKFQSVVNDAITFFDTTPVHVLPPPDQFIGPGIYGLYYHGGYEAYTRIATRNQDTYLQPIYIGKAVPPGWDMLHPGRSWAGRLTGTPPEYTAIIAKIQNFLDLLPLP